MCCPDCDRRSLDRLRMSAAAFLDIMSPGTATATLGSLPLCVPRNDPLKSKSRARGLGRDDHGVTTISCGHSRLGSSRCDISTGTALLSRASLSAISPCRGFPIPDKANKLTTGHQSRRCAVENNRPSCAIMIALSLRPSGSVEFGKFGQLRLASPRM